MPTYWGCHCFNTKKGCIGPDVWVRGCIRYTSRNHVCFTISVDTFISIISNELHPPFQLYRNWTLMSSAGDRYFPIDIPTVAKHNQCHTFLSNNEMLYGWLCYISCDAKVTILISCNWDHPNLFILTHEIHEQSHKIFRVVWVNKDPQWAKQLLH